MLRSDVRYTIEISEKDTNITFVEKIKDIILENNFYSLFRVNEYKVIRSNKDMTINKIRKIR